MDHLFNKIFDDNTDILKKCDVDLSRKESEIRSELRRQDGHRVNVNEKLLIWLERVERIQNQVNDIIRQEHEICFSCNCYSRPKLDKNVVKLIRDEVNSLLKTPSSSLLVYQTTVVAPQTFFVKLDPKISGQIWKCLMDPMIGTIGLYGLGGIGKTTTMRNIIDQLADIGIFDKIIWVSLSKNVSWEEALENIVIQLSVKQFVIDRPRTSEEEKELVNKISQFASLNKKDMFELLCYKDFFYRAFMICENLKKVKNCLCILDDMWEAVPVMYRETMIPKPTKENGCKIAVTTRFPSVLTEMGVDVQIGLAPFSGHEAWDLFATRLGDQVLKPEIQSIAEEIVNECAGLPITIVTVAHAMRGEKDMAAWKLALEDLQWTQQTEDYKFKPEELIRCWMAEDYIHNAGDIVAAIDEGVGILRELQEANMLFLFVESSYEFLKMHDLIRDLAIGIMEAENDTAARAGAWLQCHKLDRAFRPLKKISLIGNKIDTLEIDFMCSNLLTLLLKDNPLSTVSPLFFSHMPNLQVLDMSYSGIGLLPPSLCELPKLRVLFLQFCTNLKKVPALENLRELQYLNLCGTLIRELPQGIERLPRLKSLDVSDTIRLKYIHPGVISALTNLEELHMQGSGICKMDQLVAVEHLKEIRCLERLSILTLSAVGFQDHLDTILYLQRHNLKRFSVNVYGSTEDYAEDV